MDIGTPKEKLHLPKPWNISLIHVLHFLLKPWRLVIYIYKHLLLLTSVIVQENLFVLIFWKELDTLIIRDVTSGPPKPSCWTQHGLSGIPSSAKSSVKRVKESLNFVNNLESGLVKVLYTKSGQLLLIPQERPLLG